MGKLIRPGQKRPTKWQKEALEKFRTPTAELRDPAPKTIGDLVTGKYLERMGSDENYFPVYKTTEKGLDWLEQDDTVT
jgi:hypothetical protein